MRYAVAATWQSVGVPIIGFLHTAAVHVNTFDRLLRERTTEVSTVHVVRPELLEG